MKNLENYNVIALEEKELKEVQGGFLIIALFLAAAFAVGFFIGFQQAKNAG